jgi:CheY-like chemotaxis protein
VEDNPVNLLVAQTPLTRAGYQVDTAENGVEALAALEMWRYDLILMDIQMPVMDGVEAIQRIRALSPPVGRVPIVVLSAHAMEDARRHYERIGASGFLSKPVDRDKLLAMARQWIGAAAATVEEDRLSRIV